MTARRPEGAPMRQWHALGVAGLTGFLLSALYLIELEPLFFQRCVLSETRYDKLAVQD